MILSQARIDMFRWFIVQARPNCEKSVALNLKARIAEQGLSDCFGDILVPCEEVQQMKNGQKRTSTRNFFPGYVLVQIQAGDNPAPEISIECWHVVKSTPKVLGFIGGSGERPLPMSDKEAAAILDQVKKSEGKPTYAVEFVPHQKIKIVQGPFADFDGVVQSVDYEKGMVKADVLVFGRSTPVDFALDHIKAA